MLWAWGESCRGSLGVGPAGQRVEQRVDCCKVCLRWAWETPSLLAGDGRSAVSSRVQIQMFSLISSSGGVWD